MEKKHIYKTFSNLLKLGFEFNSSLYSVFL